AKGLEDDATDCFEEDSENEQMDPESTASARNQENTAEDVRDCSAVTAVEKTGFFPVDPKKYEKMFKARNKDSKTRMNFHLKAKNSTIHSLNKDTREYNRLQGEVELLKTLCHSNIVGFLGTSLYQHVVSIFMEYIPGGSIASILHRFGPLPERVLALYTHQILEGVAFLHQNRVIHRDLKGNNVMLMPTGVIKLIDFGCARRLSCLNHTAPNSGELLKSIHGTPYWMAPEIINESGYGRKSDIWSVGCTVFEMATGKPPLAHMDKMAALFYIGARRGLMPSLPDGFSENAKDFVKICLTSDQSVRPSADQLLKHSFIPKGHTSIKYCEKRKSSCLLRHSPLGLHGALAYASGQYTLQNVSLCTYPETVSELEVDRKEGKQAEVLSDACLLFLSPV
uniref:Mitogen-activated protein kinase kinase kinase 19 n=1 Tax=Xiphophorus couchianus TaxID=32473 RepID=A0A3B5M729_9TELE